MTRRAAVIGAGVVGLAAARALTDDGWSVTVHEQFRIGTELGSSSGASRVYRLSYRKPEYCRLARQALEGWRALDPDLLVENGMLEWGGGVELHAETLAACGERFEWLGPRAAAERFPEARFDGDVLWQREAGALRASAALERLAAGLDVREKARVVEPGDLDADLVVVCAGAWLGRFFDLPLEPQIEQVSYFAGAPDTRPVVIDHGPPLRYGLVAPGVGFKAAEDGARPGYFDPDAGRPIDGALEARLSEHVAATLPGLDPRPLRSEACLYTNTPDGDFVLDRIGDALVFGGDSGHAFKFAPVLGRMLADLAAERELPPEAALFRADRFGVPAA